MKNCQKKYAKVFDYLGIHFAKMYKQNLFLYVSHCHGTPCQNSGPSRLWQDFGIVPGHFRDGRPGIPRDKKILSRWKP